LTLSVNAKLFSGFLKKNPQKAQFPTKITHFGTLLAQAIAATSRNRRLQKGTKKNRKVGFQDSNRVSAWNA